jgi:hypothetical protein
MVYSPSRRPLLVSMLLVLSAMAGAAGAEPPRTQHELKARLAGQEARNPTTVTFSPLTLSNGSRLTLVSPSIWAPLTEKLAESLSQTHAKFSTLLGPLPSFEATVHLMEEESFYRETRAPRWTNALYYKQRITIPVSLNEPINYDNMIRSVRHEYTHAIVNSLSGGKCPGWLDEGLAQWAEGDENPALKPALAHWLGRHEPVSLSILQGGYTKLDMSLVAAAYAQSLYITRVVINTFGFSVMRRYFDGLRSGTDKKSAFARHFGLTESDFESRTALLLRRWARGQKGKRRA